MKYTGDESAKDHTRLIIPDHLHALFVRLVPTLSARKEAVDVTTLGQYRTLFPERPTLVEGGVSYELKKFPASIPVVTITVPHPGCYYVSSGLISYFDTSLAPVMTGLALHSL